MMTAADIFSPRWKYYHRDGNIIMRWKYFHRGGNKNYFNRGGKISTAVEIPFHLINNFSLDS